MFFLIKHAYRKLFRNMPPEKRPMAALSPSATIKKFINDPHNFVYQEHTIGLSPIYVLLDRGWFTDGPWWRQMDIYWFSFQLAKPEPPPAPPFGLKVSITSPFRFAFSNLGGFMSNFLLPDDKQFTLTAQPVDAKGSPVTLPSPPTWSTNDPTVLQVTAGTDGLSATIVPVGQPGTSAQVTVVATNADGTTAQGIFAVDIANGDAVSVNLIPGELTDIPTTS